MTLACRAQCPGAKVEAVPLDLASLRSVGALADKCLQGGRPLSVLVNNAGAPAPGSPVNRGTAARCLQLCGPTLVMLLASPFA